MANLSLALAAPLPSNLPAPTPAPLASLDRAASWIWTQLPWHETNWLGALLIHLGVIAVVSTAAFLFISRLGQRLASAGHWPEGLSFVRQFYWPAQLFLIGATVGVLPETTSVPAHIAKVLDTGSTLVVVISLMAIGFRTSRTVASIYEKRLKIEQSDNLRERRLKTQIQYLQKIIDLVIIFVGASALMLSFDSFRKIGGSLLASAGLASVILGFSAQKSLGNLIAGFQIAFTQPIRWGDAVLVEGEWGEIEEITLTYVVVRIWDLRRMILPINYFLEKPFQNWTRTSADLIGTVMLYVDYTMPVQDLRAELVRLVKTTSLWDGKVVVLQVTDATDRTMQLRLLVSARTAGQAFDLRCIVREKMIAFIQEHYPDALPKSRLGAVRLDDTWATPPLAVAPASLDV